MRSSEIALAEPLWTVREAAAFLHLGRNTVYEWAERAGKQLVRCNDTFGFIVNRILISLLNDCVRALAETGVEP